MFITAFTKNFHLFPYSARWIQSMHITKPHILLFHAPFPAFYGTQTFITTYTRNRHLSVFWVTAIQFVPQSYFLKIQFNIILPSRTKSSKRSRHLNQVYGHAFSHTCYIPCPSHSFLFDYANICWGVRNMKHIPTDRTMAPGSTQRLVKISTRNISWGKGGRCVRLTTPPPSRAECHEIWESKPPGTLWATPGLLRDCFTFTLF
jgi:hypothetical protein